MSLRVDLTRALQSRLAELSYYRLRIDGEPGRGSSEAIVRFKKTHGLAAEDFASQLTLAALYASDAKPAPAP